MTSKAASSARGGGIPCLVLALCLAWAAATEVYVNPSSGSDSAPGTSTRPVATIHRAVAVAAAASAPAGSTVHAAEIHLATTATGTHRLQKAVVVPATDAAGVNMTFEFQPWVVGDGDGMAGASAGKAFAAVSGMAASPFRATPNATFPPLDLWNCTFVRAGHGHAVANATNVADNDDDSWCSIGLASLNFTADQMDVYTDSTTSMQRLLRLRSETLHWTSTLNPSNKSDPINAQGFYINASAVSGLSLSPASVAGWKVWAFHSWTKSRHTVRAVDLDADPAQGAKMLFAQDTDFPYGQYTYCSLERFYIEGAPELLQRPASDVRGDFLILPEAGSGAPGNASCGSVPCQIFMRKSLVAAAVASQATLGLPVTPDLFLTESAELDSTTQCTTAARLADRPWAHEVARGNGGFDRFGSRFFCPEASQQLVQNLTFRGLRFEGTQTSCQQSSSCDGDAGGSSGSSAIRVQDAPGLSVTECEFRATGGWGIKASLAPFSTIANITMTDMGAGAVSMFASLARPDSFSQIRNVTVVGFGQTIASAIAITIYGHNITVDSCEISGGLYDGFAASQSGGWNEGSVLSNSVIHSNGRTDDTGICDFGAVHCGGAGGELPFFMHDNVFANISAYQNGGDGIYLDVSATGFDIRRNLVYGTQSSPLYWHINPFVPMSRTAQPVVLENNFFVANGNPNAFQRTHPGPIMRWYSYTAANVSRNIIVAAPPSDGVPDPGNTAFVFDGKPCAQDEDPKVVGQPCTNNYADNFDAVASSFNLFWNLTSGAPMSPTFPNGGTLEKWQATAGANGTLHEAGSISADPLFVDIAHSNFHLTDGASPALLKLGIQQLQ